MSWILWERFDPLFAMEHLKQFYQRKQTEQDNNMLNIIQTEDELTNVYDNLNPLENIIILTPENKNQLSGLPQGTISIQLNQDINFSFNVVGSNNISSVDYTPIIKMVIPQGLTPKFHLSSHVRGFTTLKYVNYDLVTKTTEMKDGDVYHHIYDKFEMTLDINVKRIRQKKSSFIFKNGIPIFELGFEPILNIWNPTYLPIQNIYWIKNTEMYKNIQNIF